VPAAGGELEVRAGAGHGQEHAVVAVVVVEASAEPGHRPLLEAVVDEEVDLLVVEGDQPGDLLALVSGRVVR
jgi:hypothetical protein